MNRRKNEEHEASLTRIEKQHPYVSGMCITTPYRAGAQGALSKGHEKKLEIDRE